jgi:hypothetical protein
MRCSDVKKVLLSYIYDELSSTSKEKAEKHLVECQQCKDELKGIMETKEICEYWLEQPINKHFLQNTFLIIKPEILTPEELAVYLRIPVNDVIANLETIPHFKIGKSIRFRREVITKWIEKIEHIPHEFKSELLTPLQTPQNRIFDITLS